MNIIPLMLCAMLAGAAPLALLFVPLLLPAKPVPAPPAPRPFVPRPQWPHNKCTCPTHGTPLGQNYECEECGYSWQFDPAAKDRMR